MSAATNLSPFSVMYISHGGGPLPLLGDEAHIEMVDGLKYLVKAIPKPSSIIVISAHWEEDKPTITAAQKPSLIYDYYGFPKETYEIKYPAPGEPVLARKISDQLKSKDIEAIIDEQRGFDHGLFVPLKIMYPEANIPCVQISLLNSLKPEAHIKIGEALRNLDLSGENVLVVGSGFSFHNLKAFFSPATDESRAMNESFENWLIETCISPALTESERANRLLNWESAPAARYCHPREEHLLPLHVCFGLANRAADEVLSFEVLGKKASAYLWMNKDVSKDV